MAHSSSHRELRVTCMQTCSCNLSRYSERTKGIAYSKKTVCGHTCRRSQWQCSADSLVTSSFPQVFAPAHPQSRFVPLDYFLWGYLKDKIFETAIPNENAIYQRITEEIQRIPPHILHMLFRNIQQWAFMCKNVLGTQFHHLL